MGKLIVECDTGKVSDGYHTFDDLYEHRCVLFVSLMRCRPELSWRAWKHHDGGAMEGWFIAGMSLRTGEVSYHLPKGMWEWLDGSGCRTLEVAPAWDGHKSTDVVERLRGHFCQAEVS